MVPVFFSWEWAMYSLVITRRVNRVFSLSLSRTTLTLSSLRSAATRLYVLIAWLHVPAVALVALNARNAWLPPTMWLLGIAIAATICARTLRDGLPLRLVMAAALTAAPIFFVYAGRGSTSGLLGHETWQIDYHMYFFATFAMLVGYVDWRPIVFSAALTAGHHLLLDRLVPGNVFPEEGLDRVALHAITVVAECRVLIGITNTVQALFDRIDGLMYFTTAATAEAIADAQAENTRLKALLARVSS